MDKEMQPTESTSLEQFGVTIHPDLRIVVFRGERGIEVHLAPSDAIDMALLLFKFAYQIPGEHQDILRAMTSINQPKDNLQ